MKEWTGPDLANPRSTINIKSRTARRWLNCLGYSFRNVKKDVFVDGHERPDVIEDRVRFLKIMENLDPYTVEFKENGTIKSKSFPEDCQIGEENRRPIICITHDECTFSANDSKSFAWQMKGDTLLRPKGKGRGIMVSDFLLPFGRLGFSHLPNGNLTSLIETEAVKIFEYGKNNDGYWDGLKLLKQVVEKTLPIAEALYPGYSFLFMFDNATSHAVYADDALCAGNMNKSSEGKQPLLRDGWFEVDGIRHFQQMSYFAQDGTLVPKGIQRILEKRSLWPELGLNWNVLSQNASTANRWLTVNSV